MMLPPGSDGQRCGKTPRMPCATSFLAQRLDIGGVTKERAAVLLVVDGEPGVVAEPTVLQPEAVLAAVMPAIANIAPRGQNANAAGRRRARP